MTPTAPPSAAGDRAVFVPEVWGVAGGEIRVDGPVIMGVLNVTPDSFSDGGRHLDPAEAARRALEMAAEGADILDVGGESTRPGAEDLGVADELERVIPAIGAIRAAGVTLPISIDTRKAAVAAGAVAAGASIINDISALSDPEMAGVAADAGAGLVLMHMKGTPRTMQDDPVYDDVVGEVTSFLRDAITRAEAAGVDPAKIVVDPGIGFGKTLEHNLVLLRETSALLQLGRPLLIGVSRKAFIGQLLGGAPPDRRVHGTVGACLAAYARGARIFRVHDVRAAAEALRVAAAIESGGAR